MYTLLMPDYKLKLHMVALEKYYDFQSRTKWAYKLVVEDIEIFTGNGYDCPTNWDKFEMLLDCLDALLDNPEESGSSRVVTNPIELEFLESDLADEIGLAWGDYQSDEFEEYWNLSVENGTYTLVIKEIEL
jgi:hypothetical protein